MNKSDKDYLSRVSALGCLICGAGAQIHHVRTGMGLGQRNSHRNVLPLCVMHHTGGGYGVAFHAGRKTWEENFGTELELLERIRRLLKAQQQEDVYHSKDWKDQMIQDQGLDEP